MSQETQKPVPTEGYSENLIVAAETLPLLFSGSGTDNRIAGANSVERDRSEESSMTLTGDGEGDVEEEVRRGGGGVRDRGGASNRDRDADTDAANQSVGTARAVLITMSLWVLIFLQAANMSGITTTQSTIAEDLDAFEEASWFTSAYLIGASSIAPLSGRLSQIFSARNCIFVSSVIFALGGLFASQARSIRTFLLGRIITGVGAAGILTISTILVLELTGKKRRGLFIGLVNAGYTSGVALGAVIAGALLPVCGWRALFWAQMPLALLAGTVIFYSIPKSFTAGPQSLGKVTTRQKLSKVDYLGAITLTSTIVLFLYGLASAHIQWIPILISPILLAIFICNETYFAREPIIPIVVLKSRGVLLTCFAQLGVMAARWLVLFYTPVYTIAVRDWAPVAAGSILIPTNLGFGLGGLLVGWLHIRRAGSYYLSSILSFALFTLTLLLLAHISTPSTPIPLYIFTTFLNGLVTGAALNYTLAHLLHLSAPNVHFIVLALLATFRGFAGSFGSTIGGGIFTRILEASLTEGFHEHGLWDPQREALVRKLLGSPAMVGGLRGDERVVAVEGYLVALRGMFLCGVLGAGAMVLVQAGTGWRKPGGEENENERAAEMEGEREREREHAE